MPGYQGSGNNDPRHWPKSHVLWRRDKQTDLGSINYYWLFTRRGDTFVEINSRSLNKRLNSIKCPDCEGLLFAQCSVKYIWLLRILYTQKYRQRRQRRWNQLSKNKWFSKITRQFCCEHNASPKHHNSNFLGLGGQWTIPAGESALPQWLCRQNWLYGGAIQWSTGA